MADTDAPPGAVRTADPTGSPATRWRSVLAVVLVVMTVVGAVALTDDNWPFAPFRMFAHAVKPDGRVVKVDFIGTTRSGRTIHLDASAFGLRRAEVEGQQDRHARILTRQMHALFDEYNRAHPHDPLVHLEFRQLGSVLVDGKPVSRFQRSLQTWPPRTPAPAPAEVPTAAGTPARGAGSSATVPPETPS